MPTATSPEFKRKGITLPPSTLATAERCRKIRRRNFSNYVAYLIDEDAALLAEEAKAKRARGK